MTEVSNERLDELVREARDELSGDDAKDSLDAVRELKRLRAEREWRPIETLPEPKTPFDRVMCQMKSGIVFIRQIAALKALYAASLLDGEECYAVGWMPLPAAPARDGGE